MIKVRGLASIKLKALQAQALMEIKVAEGVKQKLTTVFSDLVRITPQYTGNLASNWYIHFGTKPGYNPIASYVGPDNWKPIANPYIMGDDPAVSSTLKRELVKLDSLRFKIFGGGVRKIGVINVAPYAAEVEYGILPNMREFRPGNVHDKYAVEIMKEYILMKYGTLKYKGI